MWIKTIAGALVNVDRAETIYFDEDDDKTYACIDDRTVALCDGDCTPAIREAITKNRTFMEVH